MKNIKIVSFFPYLLCILFALIAGLPLLHPGMIPTHDGEYHVIRFYEFYKMLQNRAFYPRWAPDLYYGYGVPLFTYVYPLPNYFASFLHFFSVSFIDSFKLNMLFASIVGSMSMYVFSKTYWGKLGGIVAALFYTYSPYHFVDMYVRGSVGEIWGLGLFPLLLWSLDRVRINKNFSSTVIASILCALIIFSHNILALIYITATTAYVMLLIISEKINYLSVLRYLLVIILGLGLSGIFWLPAILEKKYVVGLQVYDVTKNFVDLSQLIIPSWGSDFFGSMSATSMSVQIGVANLLAVLICIVVLVKLFKKRDSRFLILFLMLILFSISCFLMLPASKPLWENIPLLSYFQFPWRLLSVVIFCCSFFAGSITVFSKRYILAVVITAFVFLSTYQYSFPAHYFIRKDNYYIYRSNFIDGTNSVGNGFNTRWAGGITKRSNKFIDFVYPGDVISYKRFEETNFILQANLSKGRIITLNTLYFPGWTILANGKPIPMLPDKFGRTQFFLSKGTYTVRFYLQETLLQKLSKWLSIISLIILFLIFINSYCFFNSLSKRKFLGLFYAFFR